MRPARLGIADRAFWSDPVGAARPAEDALIRTGGEHIVLDMPSRVDLLAPEGTLPAILLRVAPEEAARRVRFLQHAVLVATALERNRTWAAPVEDPELAPPRLDLTGIEIPPPSGMVSTVTVVDLRDRLALPWDRPATLLVRLLFRERVLCESRVVLEGGQDDYRDPEVERLLAAREAEAAPAAVWPVAGEPRPRYDGEGAPPLPDAAGIVLVAERLIPVDSSTPCILRGSFRLPIRPRDRAPRSPLTPLLSRLPTAVVPISIVLVGSRYAAPVVWRLAVPSFRPLEERGGALLASGHFEIDLQELANLRDLPQTYFLHAFSGEHAASPAVMAVVAPRPED